MLDIRAGGSVTSNGGRIGTNDGDGLVTVGTGSSWTSTDELHVGGTGYTGELLGVRGTVSATLTTVSNPYSYITGNGTINSPVTNDGIIAPAPRPAPNIGGDYTQGDIGSLEIDLLSTTFFDRLADHGRRLPGWCFGK